MVIISLLEFSNNFKYIPIIFLCYILFYIQMVRYRYAELICWKSTRNWLGMGKNE
jgi:hypothetical protein